MSCDIKNNKAESSSTSISKNLDNFDENELINLSCVELDQSRKELHALTGTILANVLSLKNLIVLNLSYNYLKSIPTEITQLKMIETFNISHNSIQDMNNVDWSVFKLLTSLDASFNDIKSFPQFLSKSTSIKYLNMNKNCLKNLPKDINRLNKLEYFYFNNNYIDTLPDEFYSLINIKGVDMGYNNIKVLSSKISKLTKLFKLDISYNTIGDLPQSMIYLYNLNQLNIEGNPLINPPLSVINLGMMHIFKYLAETTLTSNQPKGTYSNAISLGTNYLKNILQQTKSSTETKLHKFAYTYQDETLDLTLFEKFQKWKNQQLFNKYTNEKRNKEALYSNAIEALNMIIDAKLNHDSAIDELLSDGTIITKYLSALQSKNKANVNKIHSTEILIINSQATTKRWSIFFKESLKLLGNNCPYIQTDINAMSKNPLNYINIILEVIWLLYNNK